MDKVDKRKDGCVAGGNPRFAVKRTDFAFSEQQTVPSDFIPKAAQSVLHIALLYRLPRINNAKLQVENNKER